MPSSIPPSVRTTRVRAFDHHRCIADASPAAREQPLKHIEVQSTARPRIRSLPTLSYNFFLRPGAASAIGTCIKGPSFLVVHPPGARAPIYRDEQGGKS